MKTKRMYLSLYVLSTVAVLANSFEPVITTVLVGVGAGLGRTIWNYFQESCEPKWISLNSTGERLCVCLHVQLLNAARFRWVSRNQHAVLCNRGRVSQEHRCQISSERNTAVLPPKTQPKQTTKKTSIGFDSVADKYGMHLF